MKASEYGIERHAAVNAEYEAILIGTVAEENARFFYNGMYFALSGNVFTAEEPGESYNGIYPGTNAVPVDSAPALNSANSAILYNTALIRKMMKVSDAD